MTKRTRAWILYLLVLVFFVVGGAAILYAEGWRAKLDPLAFDKVGGLYVRTLPNDAKLSLSGKPIKKAAGLFDPGTLLSGLFPGTYTLSVERDGYHGWDETLPVAASLVTSRSHIVLVPETGATVTSTPVGTVQVFGDIVVFTTIDGHVFHDSTLLPGNRFLAATDDGRQMITASGTAAYFLSDLSTGTSTPLNRLIPRLSFPARATTTLSAVPQSGSLFFAQSSSQLQLINIANGQVTSLETKSVSAAGATAARIAWTSFDPASDHSVISLYDLLSGRFLRGVDFIPGRVTKIAFGDRDTVFALGADKSFYQVDLALGSRIKMASGVYDFVLSPDGGSVAFLDQGGLNIFQSRSARQYLFFRIPNPDLVTAMAWYQDKAHLILGYKDAVDFLSFEDAALKNLTTIALSASFAYDPNRGIVYVLPHGILTKFEMPQ